MAILTVNQLWHDGYFLAYLGRQARRHFSNTDDMKDAAAEAWISLCSHRLKCRKEAEKVAYQAINNFYKRNRRINIKEDHFAIVS